MMLFLLLDCPSLNSLDSVDSDHVQSTHCYQELIENVSVTQS